MKDWIKTFIWSVIAACVILLAIWVSDKEDNKKMIIGTNTAFGDENGDK